MKLALVERNSMFQKNSKNSKDLFEYKINQGLLYGRLPIICNNVRIIKAHTNYLYYHHRMSVSLFFISNIHILIRTGLEKFAEIIPMISILYFNNFINFLCIILIIFDFDIKLLFSHIFFQFSLHGEK